MLDQLTRMAVNTLISERQEAAFHTLEQSPAYQRMQETQQKREAQVQELCSRYLNEDQRSILQAYQEGQTACMSDSLDAVYLKGLQDRYFLLHFLGGEDVSI